MKIFLISTALLFIFQLTLSADGGEDFCGGKRDVNMAEKAWADSVIKTIQKAMPTAPKDWIMDTNNLKSNIGRVCEKQGNPIHLVYSISYNNQTKMNNISKNFEKNSDQIMEKMEKLMAEMDQAVKTGDSKKMQDIQKKMTALQGGPSNDLHTKIEVRVNVHWANESKYRAKPFAIPQAKFGYILENENEKKVILYLGNWRKSGLDGVMFELNRKAPNTSVAFIEIVIKGGISDQLAKNINIMTLNALFN